MVIPVSNESRKGCGWRLDSKYPKHVSIKRILPSALQHTCVTIPHINLLDNLGRESF